MRRKNECSQRDSSVKHIASLLRMSRIKKMRVLITFTMLNAFKIRQEQGRLLHIEQ